MSYFDGNDHKREAVITYEPHDEGECGPDCMPFVARVNGVQVDESSSPTVLAKRLFAHGALSVRHQYDGSKHQE